MRKSEESKGTKKLILKLEVREETKTIEDVERRKEKEGEDGRKDRGGDGDIEEKDSEKKNGKERGGREKKRKEESRREDEQTASRKSGANDNRFEPDGEEEEEEDGDGKVEIKKYNDEEDGEYDWMVGVVNEEKDDGNADCGDECERNSNKKKDKERNDKKTETKEKRGKEKEEEKAARSGSAENEDDVRECGEKHGQSDIPGEAKTKREKIEVSEAGWTGADGGICNEESPSERPEKVTVSVDSGGEAGNNGGEEEVQGGGGAMGGRYDDGDNDNDGGRGGDHGKDELGGDDDGGKNDGGNNDSGNNDGGKNDSGNNDGGNNDGGNNDGGNNDGGKNDRGGGDDDDETGETGEAENENYVHKTAIKNTNKTEHNFENCDKSGRNEERKGDEEEGCGDTSVLGNCTQNDDKNNYKDAMEIRKTDMVVLIGNASRRKCVSDDGGDYEKNNINSSESGGDAFITDKSSKGGDDVEKTGRNAADVEDESYERKKTNKQKVFDFGK